MATAADIQKAIATNEKYAANYRKAGKDPAKYLTKIAALKAELSLLAAPKSAAAPSGLTNYTAAQTDAGFVLLASMGDTSGADTNPAPGAAKALGFSGVVANGTAPSITYGIFRDGGLTGTSSTNPGAGPDGFSVPFGLAEGIDRDAPYTGPGALRP